MLHSTGGEFHIVRGDFEKLSSFIRDFAEAVQWPSHENKQAKTASFIEQLKKAEDARVRLLTPQPGAH